MRKTSPTIADLEHGGRGYEPECGQPVEARKGKKTDFP